MDRRTVLTLTGTTLILSLAGCLESGETDESDDDSVSGEPVEYEVSEYAPSLRDTEVGPGDHSLAVHVETPDQAEMAFDYESLSDDARAVAESFVDETDFETELLVYVETRAPDACHSLSLTSLELREATLVGSVESTDTSGEDEDCPAVETTPALLVRVQAEPTRPSHAELDVTDGWGDTQQVSSSGVDE